MGSFNETCALSNLPICVADKVYQIFLTRNPYQSSDQKFASRGVGTEEQWFPRTPPVPGAYADYGNIEYEDSPLTALIADQFDKDAIPLPYGFNRFHTGPVVPGSGFAHYLAAAYQGRLMVRDGDGKPAPVPEEWPTWQKVSDILRKKYKLQWEPDGGGEAMKKDTFNAQPEAPGVVAVSYNSYGVELAKLREARRLFRMYDTNIVFQGKDNYNPCLLVFPKGFNESGAIVDPHAGARLFIRHPEKHPDYRELPVMSVLVRRDVWKGILALEGKERRRREGGAPHACTLQGRLDELTAAVESIRRSPLHPSFNRLAVMGGHRAFSITPVDHLMQAAYVASKTLIRSVAELRTIDYLMRLMTMAWQVPQLGNQEEFWPLRAAYYNAMAGLASKRRR